jgi:glycosyltransferase involved in cell wall biosynthesis
VTLRAAFAIPGDPERRSGGFLYERRLLAALRDAGIRVPLLRMSDAFPDPDPDDIEETLAALAARPSDEPVLLDGFLPGTLPPEGLARIAAPLVAVIHHPLGLEAALPPERAAWLLRNEAAGLRAVDAVIVPSGFVARLLRDRFGLPPSAVTVAPPGFDPVAAVRSGQRHPGENRILSVGILAERKGHDILVEALACLDGVAWSARIVGAAHDDAVEADLRARIARHGLGSRVALLGELDDAALAREWAAADLFALATRYEGYGIVLGEAMQRGLPIVAAAGGAVPETLGAIAGEDAGSGAPEPPAGLLVPTEDPAALAHALRSLLTDDRLRHRMARASAEAGRGLPRWEDTARIVADVLRMVAARGRRPIGTN